MFQHVFQCSAGHGGTEECCALCSLFLLTTQKKRAIDSNVGWEGGRVSISTSANVVLPSGSDLQAINLDLLMDGVSAVPAKSERRC